MKPIVLLGGGINHYRLLKTLTEDRISQRPIVFVSDSHKCLPLEFLPQVLAGLISREEAMLDLWSACQRTGVYFLKDQCFHLVRSEQVIHLMQYGRLPYHKLSIETEPRTWLPIADTLKDSSLFTDKNPKTLLASIHHFLKEVNRFHPRAVRVVLTGLSEESISMAYALRCVLKGLCQQVDIVILTEDRRIQNLNRKTDRLLRKNNIQCLGVKKIKTIQPHKLTFENEKSLEFDVLIPFSHWKSKDLPGRLLQGKNRDIPVNSDLSLVSDSRIFATGPNVAFEGDGQNVHDLVPESITQSLLHNIFMAKTQKEQTACKNQIRDPNKLPFLKKTMHLFPIPIRKKSPLENWQEQTRKTLTHLKELPPLENIKQKVRQDFFYEAKYRNRPWRMKTTIRKEDHCKPSYGLESFNGFNCWGSYVQSSRQICEIAILKAVTRGIHPGNLRFYLTLPDKEKHLTRHIFESTFKTIETVAHRYDIQVEGGDNFDGLHWHLGVTIGGIIKQPMDLFFRPHDYLLITRPLGFGFLWSARLSPVFDSSWLEQTFHYPLVVHPRKIMKFIEDFHPSTFVVVQEWGLLYHCLQALPLDQQLFINPEMVPFWGGVEQSFHQGLGHPALNMNWQRVKNRVFLKKNKASDLHSLLWDFLSQGTMILGVQAGNHKEALLELKRMGYKDSALIGCVRPGINDHPVVVSDWTSSFL